MQRSVEFQMCHVSRENLSELEIVVLIKIHFQDVEGALARSWSEQFIAFIERVVFIQRTGHPVMKF